MTGNYGYLLDPGLKGVLARLGVRHEELLSSAGLPVDLLRSSDARVSAEQFFALARTLQDSVTDPLLPLRLVQGLSAQFFSPPLFATLSSPNLRTAVERLARFKPLVAPVRLVVDEDSEGLRVVFHWLEGAPVAPFLLTGTEALFLVKLARMGTLTEVKATDATMRDRPPDRAAYEAFLGCPIRRDSTVSITFRTEDAARPFLSENHAMWEFFEPNLQRRLDRLAASASFEERTRAALVETLPGGQVSVELVSQRLAVSARTLQRKLSEEGTSFKEIVRDTRASLATHYLRNPEVSLDEFAYLLGFEHRSSFHRAFRDWAGQTPTTMRESLFSDA